MHTPSTVRMTVPAALMITPARTRSVPTVFLLVCLLCAALGTARGNPVTTAPAAGVPLSQPGDALLAELKKQAAAGEKHLRLPPGSYTFTGKNAVLRLEKLTGADINFDGVVFVLNREQSALRLFFCKDVTIHGLTVEYDPAPYFQGTVSSVNAYTREIFVKLEAGFPEDALTQGFTPGCAKAIFFEPDGKRMKKLPLDWVGQVSKAGDLYRIGLKEGLLFKERLDLRPGDRAVFPRRNYPNTFTVSDSEAVTFRDLTVSATPQWAFAEERGEGSHRYLHCRVVRSSRHGGLLAANADVFHSMSVKHGPLIQDCDFEYAGDDFVNVHGFYSLVLQGSNQADTTVLCPMATMLTEGSRVRILDAADLRTVDTATITHATDGGRLETLDDATARQAASFQQVRLRIPPGPFVICQVRLDHPVDFPDHALIEDPGAAGAGAQVVNSRFTDGFCRGLVIRANDAQIIGNDIERTGLAGILIGAERYWMESGQPANVSVVGNTIRDAAFPANAKDHLAGLCGGIIIDNEFDAAPLKAPARASSLNIRLSKNEVVQTFGPSIRAKDIDALSIMDNELRGTAPSPAENKQPADAPLGLVIEGCPHAEIQGNRVPNP